MALSADQRATLELVLGRGQSYTDLAQLLDASEPEVRERARSALEELGGADPDRNVELTDYLLGQADPISRADVVRHLRDDPDDNRLAAELAGKLADLVPDAELPRLPGEPRAGRFLRSRAPRESTDPAVSVDAAGRSRFSPSQSRLLAMLGAGAVLVIAVVLALTGAFAGEGGGVAAPVPGEQDDEVTRVALTAEEGADGAGEAVFGQTGSDTFYVDLDVAGLAQPAENETYVLWLMLTPDLGWPLSPMPIGPNGVFRERLAIPTGLLALVARVRSLAVALAPNRQLAALLEAAPEQVRGGEDLEDFLLEITGEVVLRGDVPIEEAPPGPDEAPDPGAEEESP